MEYMSEEYLWLLLWLTALIINSLMLNYQLYFKSYFSKKWAKIAVFRKNIAAKLPPKHLYLINTKIEAKWQN